MAARRVAMAGVEPVFPRIDRVQRQAAASARNDDTRWAQTERARVGDGEGIWDTRAS